MRSEEEIQKRVVSYEEFEELRKKLDFLTHRFNELLDWLACEGKEMKLHSKWTLLKVKEEVEVTEKET